MKGYISTESDMMDFLHDIVNHFELYSSLCMEVVQVNAQENLHYDHQESFAFALKPEDLKGNKTFVPLIKGIGYGSLRWKLENPFLTSLISMVLMTAYIMNRLFTRLK